MGSDFEGNLAAGWFRLPQNLSQSEIRPRRAASKTVLPLRGRIRPQVWGWQHSGRVCAEFNGIPSSALLTVGMDVPAAWLVTAKESLHDLDNIKLNTLGRDGRVEATYELEYILIEGHSRDTTAEAAASRRSTGSISDRQGSAVCRHDHHVQSGLFSIQSKSSGHYSMNLKAGRSRDIFKLDSIGATGYEAQPGDETTEVTPQYFQASDSVSKTRREKRGWRKKISWRPKHRNPDFVQQGANLVGNLLNMAGIKKEKLQGLLAALRNPTNESRGAPRRHQHILRGIRTLVRTDAEHHTMVSVMRHTNHTVKFWFIEQFLSPSFKEFVPIVAKEYGFQYEMVTYKWPHWLLCSEGEAARNMGLQDPLLGRPLFPLDLDKVIFVGRRPDSSHRHGRPDGGRSRELRTDSRQCVIRGSRWKASGSGNKATGRTIWADCRITISALYVVDLKRFRQLAAGDRLRQQYHQLSADPGSLSNLDQDLPNNMQTIIPIHSLDQNWLWCETWCSDESLKDAKTIDLCNNPMTKEPKLERARRQVPEWTE